MREFIKSHPFPVEAFFESSIVLAFAVSPEKIKELIPVCLEPDLFEEQWGFLVIAMVQTKGLRPRGFPKFFGRDFFLTGYRAFVRYKNNAGRSMRGLYILKSETDKFLMKHLGNIFTNYKYELNPIKTTSVDQRVEIISKQTDFKVTIEKGDGDIDLPENSPFPDWKRARKFAGPMPYTFSYNAAKKRVLIIEGVRQNWKPKPIKVLDYQIPFLETLNLPNPTLANAFIIEKVPYYWKRGRKEKWAG